MITIQHPQIFSAMFYESFRYKKFTFAVDFDFGVRLFAVEAGAGGGHWWYRALQGLLRSQMGGAWKAQIQIEIKG